MPAVTMSPALIVPNSWVTDQPVMVREPELARCLSTFSHQLYVPLARPVVIFNLRLATVWKVNVMGVPALHSTSVPVGDWLSWLGVAVGTIPCHVKCPLITPVANWQVLTYFWLSVVPVKPPTT